MDIRDISRRAFLGRGAAGLGVVALVFRCELIGGDATLNSEAKEILWLDRHEIEDVAVEAFAIRVTDALDREWAATRSHDGTNLLHAVLER